MRPFWLSLFGAKSVQPKPSEIGGVPEEKPRSVDDLFVGADSRVGEASTQQPPIRQLPVSYEQVHYWDQMGIGSGGDLVKQLQEALNQKISSHARADNSPAAPLDLDGKFGRKTNAALVELQKSLGIPESDWGAVGESILQALGLSILSPQAKTEETTSGIMNAAEPTAAHHIHYILKELGYAVGDDPNRLDDPITQASIKKIKENAGFEVNGDVDIGLLMAILESAMAKDRMSSAERKTYTGSRPGPVDHTRKVKSLTNADVKNWKAGTGDVTADQLRKIVPGLSEQKANEVAPHLNVAMKEAGIDTPQRKAAFIAQVAHESGGFKYNEEIASGSAYEGRRDLGNTEPGDGQRFKGRGFIQLTGRSNYKAAGDALGLDLVNNPELAALPENAARVAAWYWNSRGLNKLADDGNFNAITKRINGGYNGKADRDALYQRALGVGLANGVPSTGTWLETEKISADGKMGPSGNKLSQLAEQTARNMGTVGRCAAGVNQTLEKMYGGDFSGHAYQKANQLANDNRFQEIKASPDQLDQLPPGAIVVWGRSPQKQWGHVTVTLGNGMEASDHVQRLITRGAYGNDFGDGKTHSSQVRVFLPRA